MFAPRGGNATVAPAFIAACARAEAPSSRPAAEPCVARLVCLDGTKAAAAMSSNPDNRQGAPPPRENGRELDLGAWREQAIADPFEDPKVRRRIAELIIDAKVKPEGK
jgi:hypothetical protein